MSLKKKIEKQIKNMPKYAINEEAFQNQAMARSQAYGRNRALQMQEGNIEQESADAASAAQSVTGSTSSLLSTIAAINANKNSNLRGLAQDEVAAQQQNMAGLYAANQAMIDEKDKAWNQNVFAPWDAKLRNLQERKRRRQAMTDALTGAAVAVGGAAATSGIGQSNSSSSTAGSGTTEQSGGSAPSGSSGGSAGSILGAIFSDVILKEDITDTRLGLREVMAIKVVEYNYIGSEEHHIGLIAQDVQEVIPEAVKEKDGFLQINYTEIVPVLIKSIQDQQQYIKILENKIDALARK